VDFELWQLEESWGSESSSASGEDDHTEKTTKKKQQLGLTLKKETTMAAEERRRKPVSVQPPFVVVGLSEEEIAGDFKIIQRAMIEADLRRDE